MGRVRQDFGTLRWEARMGGRSSIQRSALSIQHLAFSFQPGSMMKGLLYSVLVVMLLLCHAFVNCGAQAVDAAGSIKSTIVPVRLFVPFYPRLAQQARIAGDVNLKLSVGS